ncbi:MAG TPA: head GIN domain-containing protein [Dehalococcoidia bacterium]
MWGSGNIETREYDLSGFTAVKASRFKVEIIQSETYGVTVRADDNIIDRLVVRKSGDTLYLRKRPTFWIIGPITLEATIRMPSLAAIELNGAASARIPEFRGIGRLDIEANGAAEIKGRLAAERIDVLLAGASRLRLAGSAEHVTVEASGASRLDLSELTAATGRVELSGASRATMRFTDAIESVEASGASRLRYLGDPALGRVESSGASRVDRVA